MWKNGADARCDDDDGDGIANIVDNLTKQVVLILMETELTTLVIQTKMKTG